MDAFASIISNNQNQVMKRLTSVTVMLQLPTLVASIYGMNVPIPGAHSTFAFYFPILISLGLSLLLGIYFLRKKLF
jgi:magnesium transporter